MVNEPTLLTGSGWDGVARFPGDHSGTGTDCTCTIEKQQFHPSCCHMTWLFNWVIFVYEHLLSDTLCSMKLLLFQLQVAGMPWWVVWHLLQACPRPEAHSYWWGIDLRKHSKSHITKVPPPALNILPVDRMVILPHMPRYSFSIIPLLQVFWCFFSFGLGSLEVICYQL